MFQYVNKTIVVTVNFFNGKGRFLEQYQTSGIIGSVYDDFVVIQREAESDFILPCNYRTIVDAEPGVYTIGRNKKELTNPNFKAQWIVNCTDEEGIVEFKQRGFDRS